MTTITTGIPVAAPQLTSGLPPEERATEDARGVIEAYQAARPSEAIDRAAIRVLLCALALFVLSVVAEKPESIEILGATFTIAAWRVLGMGLILALTYLCIKLMIEFRAARLLAEETVTLHFWRWARTLYLGSMELATERDEVDKQLQDCAEDTAKRRPVQLEYEAKRAELHRQWSEASDAESAGEATAADEDPYEAMKRLSSEMEELEDGRNSALRALGPEPDWSAALKRSGEISKRAIGHKARLEEFEQKRGRIAGLLKFRRNMELVFPLLAAVTAIGAFIWFAMIASSGNMPPGMGAGPTASIEGRGTGHRE